MKVSAQSHSYIDNYKDYHLVPTGAITPARTLLRRWDEPDSLFGLALAQYPFQSTSDMLNEVRLGITLLRVPHARIPRPSLAFEHRVPGDWMLRLHAQVLRSYFINVSLLKDSQHGVVRIMTRVGSVGIPLVRPIL